MRGNIEVQTILKKPQIMFCQERNLFKKSETFFCPDETEISLCQKDREKEVKGSEWLIIRHSL